MTDQPPPATVPPVESQLSRSRPQPPVRIYLSDSEAAALTRVYTNANGRVLQCAFGGGRMWLDPSTRNAQGEYPRWVVLRLAVLRGLDLRRETITADEYVELERFAVLHSRELKA